MLFFSVELMSNRLFSIHALEQSHWSSRGLMDTFSLMKESFFMPRTRTPYPTEFREKLVVLARAGRIVESLVREYEPCAATIHEWVKQAGADDGERDGRLTSAGMDELRQLRKEVRQLRQKRDILSKGRSLKARLVRAQWTTLGLHKTT
jgi:transposase